MNSEKRSLFIGGNWKMNKLSSDVSHYVEELTPYLSAVSKRNLDICLCPPYLCLERLNNSLKSGIISVAAQNISEHSPGAFTGEISCEQLLDIGINRTIIGHSETRAAYSETDETINHKLKKALSCGMSVILCVGESDFVKSSGKTQDFIEAQVSNALKDIPDLSPDDIVIAYEPIWAIGKEAATVQIAQSVSHTIRDVVCNIFGNKTAQSISIVYGGSVNIDNILDYITADDIDGVLIGSSSLSPDVFGSIITKVLELI